MSQRDCQEKWEALRQEILKRVTEIDDATPYSATEPEWWLHMMRVYTAARFEPGLD